MRQPGIIDVAIGNPKAMARLRVSLSRLAARRGAVSVEVLLLQEIQDLRAGAERVLVGKAGPFRDHPVAVAGLDAGIVWAVVS